MTWLVPTSVPCSSQWSQHTIKRETSALKVASTSPGALLPFFSFRRKARRILPPSPRVRRHDASILAAAIAEHTNTMAEKERGFKYKLSESDEEWMLVMIAHEINVGLLAWCWREASDDPVGENMPAGQLDGRRHSRISLHVRREERALL